MEKSLQNQRGIGGIIIIAAVVFVIITIAVMAYFLLNGTKDTGTATQTSKEQLNSETTISDDQVPLRICATGDPEQCDDPVSNADVDNVVVDDLP